jgi:uncharacterized protein YukE
MQPVNRDFGCKSPTLHSVKNYMSYQINILQSVWFGSAAMLGIILSDEA